MPLGLGLRDRSSFPFLSSYTIEGTKGLLDRLGLTRSKDLDLIPFGLDDDDEDDVMIVGAQCRRGAG
jgi:hypothetical protein